MMTGAHLLMFLIWELSILKVPYIVVQVYTALCRIIPVSIKYLPLNPPV